jgi:hypothetical protein
MVEYDNELDSHINQVLSYLTKKKLSHQI